MADAIALPAEARETSGKGGARATRRAGYVPGIVYGGTDKPMGIRIELRRVLKEMESPSFGTSTYDLEVAGKKVRVLPREVQTDPVTDRPTHMDFLRVSASTMVTVEIPVRFVNEKASPGLREGGVLNVVRHAIEASAPATAIPDFIAIDLSGANVGDSIHISAVTLPEDVTPTITDRDFTIATIAAPTVAKTASEENENQQETAESGGNQEG